MDEDIIIAVLLGLTILIPVAGFTLRLALKPFIDRLLAIFEARQSGQEVELLEKRLQLVEQDLQGIHREMQHLTEERDFYRQLRSGEGASEMEGSGSASPR